MALYRCGRYRQALARLSCLEGREDLIGNLARFYTGLSHRALGIEAMRRGEFAPAEGHLRAAASILGREADLTSYLAAIYANTGRHRACAIEMEKGAEHEEATCLTWRKLAQAQWRAGRRAEAHMTLTAALRRFDDSAELNMQLALFYAAEERFEDAHRCLRAAVEADCTNPDAHLYLGLSAAAQGAVLTAAQSFQRAFDLRPHDLMLALQLALVGKAAAENGYPLVLRLPEPAPTPATSQARQLANYVAAESDFIDAFLALPRSYADGELFGMLAEVIQMALAEHDDYADLQHYCACVLRRLGRGDRAFHHAARAVEINPRYVQARLLLARLHADRGDLSQAVVSVHRAIRCGADWPDIHCLTGEWLIRCDRREEAQAHLRRALQLKAEYPRAAEALASLAA
jgi:Flp pilus assembly protein TadD